MEQRTAQITSLVPSPTSANMAAASEKWVCHTMPQFLVCWLSILQAISFVIISMLSRRLYKKVLLESSSTRGIHVHKTKARTILSVKWTDYIVPTDNSSTSPWSFSGLPYPSFWMLLVGNDMAKVIPVQGTNMLWPVPSAPHVTLYNPKNLIT